MQPTLIPIPALSDNYIWLIVNSSNGKAVCVDPGEAAPVDNYLKKHNLTLTNILITHHHWDHTNGVSELASRYQAKTYGPPLTVKNHTVLKNNDEVVLGDMNTTFTTLAIPGHTLDHLAYYTPGILFCGDTLFAAGCGRLFEGRAEQLFDSLNLLAALPTETRVYCAHEYTVQNLTFAKTVEPNNQAIQKRLIQCQALQDKHQPTLPSTLALEQQTNPFLRYNEPNLIQSVENHIQKKVNSPLQVFTALRLWKDQFK